ncbi:MAG: hypothetical protein QNJ36_19535 [Calothrix sp. MO_167.B42]|nr:hypothetical protein [Calothrix sp. MO_167.B42]
MIRRSLLTAALVLVGSVAMAPKTMAESIDVPFSGIVGGGCTFGPVTSGVLIVADGASSTSTAITSISPGVGGQVSVTCNQPARLTVSQPVQTAGPTLNPVISNGFVNSPTGGTDSSGGNPMALNADGNPTPLEVGMFVENDSPLQAGIYNYNVTLTIVP